jgi:hypothetical protein
MNDTAHPAPIPERAVNVRDIEIGHATIQGSIRGLAFRLHLNDGSKILFALPEASASQFAAKIQERLARMHEESAPGQSPSEGPSA